MPPFLLLSQVSHEEALVQVLSVDPSPETSVSLGPVGAGSHGSEIEATTSEVGFFTQTSRCRWKSTGHLVVVPLVTYKSTEVL